MDETRPAAWGWCYVKVGVQPERLLIYLTNETFADEALRFPLTAPGTPPRAHADDKALSVAEALEKIEEFLASFGTWEEIHRRRPGR